MSSRSSRRARGSCAALLGAWAMLIYVFLFAPIVLLVAVQLQREPVRHVPVHGLDDALVRRRSSATTRSRTRSTTTLHVAAEVTVVATIVGTAAAFPLVRSRLPFRERRPRRVHAADHDPRAADRRQPAGPPHERVPLAALPADGRDRPVRLHDAVRAAARRGEAAGLRPLARARCVRPRREHVPPAALRRAAADHARRSSRARSSRSRSRSTSSSSRCS